MIKRKTKLTWLDEWLVYLEYIYGRTFTRWQYFEKTWNIGHVCLRNIVLEKLKMVLYQMKRWPKFATLEEDTKLRKEHWNDMIENNLPLRLIIHDMTDVPLDAPSDSETNRATFSKYYKGNCGKGGIFTQLCA